MGMALDVCLALGLPASVQAFSREAKSESANVWHPALVCPFSQATCSSCCVLSQVLMSDSAGDAALREQRCLLICSELTASPPRAQFYRLLGLFEPSMALRNF